MTDEMGSAPEGGGTKGMWDTVKGLFIKAKDSEAAEKAGEVAEKVWDKTKDVAEKAWEKTKDVAGEVKDKVEEKLEERREGTSEDDTDT